MRSIGAVLLVALTGVSVPFVAQTPDPVGDVPMFSGRDLSGWVNINCAPDTWSVEDGIVHCTGAPICELRTDRMYENFILELEWQHLKPKGNAGVFVWADALPARGGPFLRAVEVQVLDGSETANSTSHGDVFAIHGARMTPDRPHPAGWMRSLPSEKRARPAGQWNHYRITANNGTVKLAVNGKEVSGGYDITPRKGYIALESEGSLALFRNVRIKELPASSGLKPDEVARPDEGFVSLYNGKDLSGWRPVARTRSAWYAKDWTIVYAGANGAASGALWSEEEYGDIVLMVDWRYTSERGPDVMRALAPGEGWSPPRGARVAVVPRPLPSGDRGAWHRALVTMKGQRLTVDVDGHTLVDNVEQPGVPERGPFLIQSGEAAMELANIFVKRLD
ncbi:MAG: DUF1080 domain-containing protein [Luteitalea sp.]|nr:DUF1080 domain-containing protein [Luteitalea sp.]